MEKRDYAMVLGILGLIALNLRVHSWHLRLHDRVLRDIVSNQARAASEALGG